MVLQGNITNFQLFTTNLENICECHIVVIILTKQKYNYSCEGLEGERERGLIIK